MVVKLKSKRSVNVSSKIWYSKEGPLRLGDMSVRHLISAFHMTKEIGAGDNCTTLSDEQFTMQVFPEYDWLRQEIAKRLHNMPKGSLQRAYWHSKFSHRALNSYPAVTVINEPEDPDFFNGNDE